MIKKQDKQKDSPKAEHYFYSVGWSETDETFVARVAEFPSLAAHGETQKKALREIKEVVRFVLNDLPELGETLPVAFGKAFRCRNY
jgi:predicted RNase H-like HicB family nuclease